MKELKSELEGFTGEEFFWLTKKLSRARLICAYTRWCWRASLLDVRTADGGQDHEGIVTFDGVITLEHAFIVGIPPTTASERNVATSSTTITVTVVLRETNAPAIPALASVIRGLRRRRHTLLSAITSRLLFGTFIDSFRLYLIQHNVDGDIFARVDDDCLECIAARQR